MPANFDSLNKAAADLATEVAATIDVEESAVKSLNGVQALVTDAVTKALTADNAANADSIKAATDAINSTFALLGPERANLAAAVAANNPAPAPTV